MKTHIWSRLLIAVALSIVVAFPAGTIAREATPDRLPPGSECVPSEIDDSCLPVAPEGDRIDRGTPTFSDPTNITNPLFPISNLHSALLMGTVDDLPFRVEVSLLPEPHIIEWNGQQVETLAAQYHAYLDGRIQEIAIDWYAQADDGAVWYFGEDVFNYEDGVVVDTDGTWVAGTDGPPGMIMPADPQVGDVYRPENLPGNVFEEVTVLETGVTVDGPVGPITNAIVIRELHQDGGLEEKTFAPGYGEFFTDSDGDLEAAALAVPHDAIDGPMPAELDTLTNEAIGMSRHGITDASTSVLARLTDAWDIYRVNGVPPMLEDGMNAALDDLGAGLEANDPDAVRGATIDVARTALDLQLRYRPVTDVDRARFALWTDQIAADVLTGDPDAVAGDVASLAWTWERIAHTVTPDTAAAVESHLAELSAAARDGDLDAVTSIALELRDVLERSSSRP